MSEARRCYYDILGVDRKAEEDEIRRAYKKSALRCHPDRNHGNEEAAALEFKEVQNAYTVLMDADERAWYDNHRDAILRGDDGAGASCAPDELNVYEYFNARCYDNFNDDDRLRGFYHVYRKVFDTIIKEECDYNDKFAKTAPTFGDSKSPWSQVGAFYVFWKNFITNKTFAWKDEYKLSEIADRYFRREAERHNMKARAQGRRDYISVVQQLVHHIYIRDPRVIAEKARAEEEREQKAAEKEKRDAEAAKRRREANKKIWEEAAEREAQEMEERAARGEDYDGAELEMLYEKQRQMERAAKKGDKKGMREAAGAHATSGDVSGKSRIIVGGFADPSSSEDESDGEGGRIKKGGVWKCVGCKKNFASDKLFQEHIKSSKHKTKFKQLEKQGTDVNSLLITPNGPMGGAAAAAPATDGTAAAAPSAAAAPAKKGGKKNNNNNNDSDLENDEDVILPAKKDKKEVVAPAAAAAGKNKKGGAADSDNDSDDDNRKKKKGGKAAPPAPAAPATKGNKGNKKGKRHGDDSDDDDAPPSTMKPSAKFQKSKAKAAAKKAAAEESDDEEDEESSEEEVIITTKNKFSFGKKK